MLRMGSVLIGLIIILSVTGAEAAATRTNTDLGLGGYDTPFYRNAEYRAEVKSPTEFLGFELGAHPVGYRETMAYVNYLAETFPSVMLTKYAETYEGRDLVYLVVSSPENIGDIDTLRENIGLLADPRDPDQLTVRSGQLLGDRDERGVGEHHIGRNLRRGRRFGPPVTQALVELFVHAGGTCGTSAQFALRGVQ